MRPLIAIVGRPNVGKSTLFNKLVGAPIALVEDIPGVTRDRHYGDGDWRGRALSFVDTGGFVPEGETGAIEPGRTGQERARPLGGGPGGRLASVYDDEVLLASIRSQAQLAVEEAAAIIFVCDATEGLVPGDEEVGRLLRRSGKPLFVVANKVDSDKRERELPISDFYRMGVDEVFPVSAEHGRGVADLLDALLESLPQTPLLDEMEERPDDGKIRLAVVGRPNVGKSTLLNALLGKQRFIASAVPGTTHDPVDEELDFQGQRFVLTDTAGIRRRKSISARIESFSVIRALKALESCDVAAVLVDPSEIGVEQDSHITGLAEAKGRALILVVNKWDLHRGDPEAQERVREDLRHKMPFVAWAPIVFVSALEGKNVEKVLELAITLYKQASARIPTPVLNDFVQDVQNSHPAPLWRGLPVRLFFAAQVASRPVTVAVTTNRPQAIVDSYRRYIMNRLREDFALEVPIRLLFRQKTGDRRRKKKS